MSPDTLSALRLLHARSLLLETDRPDWLSLDRLLYLEDQRLIRSVTVCPPGKEPEFPRGLIGYELTPAGEDALAEYESSERQRTQQEQNQTLKDALEGKRWRKDARRSWVQWTITTIISLVSFFAGAVTEVLTGFVEWILALLH